MTDEKISDLRMSCATYMAKRLFDSRGYRRYILDLYGSFDNLLEHCRWTASLAEIDDSMNEHQVTSYLCTKLYGRVTADLSKFAGMPIKQGEYLRDAKNGVEYCGYEDACKDSFDDDGYDLCMSMLFDKEDDFLNKHDREKIVADIKKIIEYLDENRPVQQKTSYADCFDKLMRCGLNVCECARRYGKTKQRWAQLKQFIIVEKLAPRLRELYPEYVCGDIKLPNSK